MKKKIKVAIAMSGGVDSGMAAALLVKKGYQCTGFHMRLWQEPAASVKQLASNFENKCCSTESLEAARKTAHQLGMPFYVVDFSQIFKKRVVDYFLSEYASGLTPNPCVMCNKFIKFGELLNYVRKLGFDYLATGHYCRLKDEIPNSKHEIRNNIKIQNSKFKIYHLLQAKDKTKDQSYFLYNLTQKQLAHILFPIGDYTKKQVRQMAKSWHLPTGGRGLPVAERPESQEICFLPESDYRPFLKRRISKKIKSGEVVDIKGNIIGTHLGLPLYTIGQRHGFNIYIKNQKSKIKNIPPYYVIDKEAKNNRLVVGFGKETEKKEFKVKDVNWINQIYESRIMNHELWVRIRHQGELLNGKVANLPVGKTGFQSGKVKVILDEPERGIAPGQAAVFYSLKLPFEVLGGGIIE